MSFANIQKTFRKRLSLSAEPVQVDVEKTKMRLDGEIDALQRDLTEVAFEIVFHQFPSEAEKLDLLSSSPP